MLIHVINDFKRTKFFLRKKFREIFFRTHTINIDSRTENFLTETEHFCTHFPKLIQKFVFEGTRFSSKCSSVDAKGSFDRHAWTVLATRPTNCPSVTEKGKRYEILSFSNKVFTQKIPLVTQNAILTAMPKKFW